MLSSVDLIGIPSLLTTTTPSTLLLPQILLITSSTCGVRLTDPPDFSWSPIVKLFYSNWQSLLCDKWPVDWQFHYHSVACPAVEIIPTKQQMIFLFKFYVRGILVFAFLLLERVRKVISSWYWKESFINKSSSPSLWVLLLLSSLVSATHHTAVLAGVSFKAVSGRKTTCWWVLQPGPTHQADYFTALHCCCSLHTRHGSQL